MRLRFRHVLYIAVWALSARAVSAQSKKPEDLAAGKLLVVPREAPDPRFAQSVVLLVRYDRSGALGLMINHRSAIPISRALTDIRGSDKRSDPIYLGGPVETTAVMALVRSQTEPGEASRIFDNLFLVTSKKGLEGALAAKTPADLHIYAGYCGWASGQLEGEIELGGWYIFDRNEADVFDARPDTLWSRLVGRTELHIAVYGGGPGRNKPPLRATPSGTGSKALSFR
jgi:putative transcriptional regulator